MRVKILTRVTCNSGIPIIARGTFAGYCVIARSANSICSTLFYPTCIDARARVTLLCIAAIEMNFTLGYTGNLNTFAIIANVEAIRTDTSHGSERQCIFHNTFLTYFAWVS